MDQPRRILLIRLGAVGDVVRTMPALGPLSRHFPEARLSWVAEEGAASLLEGHPDLDEVIRMPRRLLASALSEPSTFFSGLALARGFARGLRERRFDWALDFHGTFKSGLVSRASGAPVRYGFLPPGSKEANWLFSNRRVTIPPEPIHRIERTLALVRATGAAVDRGDAGRVGLPIRNEHRERIDQWISSQGIADRRRILVYPGTSQRQAFKRYPVALMARVAAGLSAHAELAVIIAGGPGEGPLVTGVAEGASGRALVAPDLDLLGLAELARQCALFVGPDTGPMHLAWAVGTRVLAIFGPTDPTLNAPWGQGHTVLYNAVSQGRGDAVWPAPEEVVSTALEMMSVGQRPGAAPVSGVKR